MSPELIIGMAVLGAIVFLALTHLGFYRAGISLGSTRTRKEIAEWLNAEQARIQGELHDDNRPASPSEALDRL